MIHDPGKGVWGDVMAKVGRRVNGGATPDGRRVLRGGYCVFDTNLIFHYTLANGFETCGLKSCGLTFSLNEFGCLG